MTDHAYAEGKAIPEPLKQPKAVPPKAEPLSIRGRMHRRVPSRPLPYAGRLDGRQCLARKNNNAVLPGHAQPGGTLVKKKTDVPPPGCRQAFDGWPGGMADSRKDSVAGGVAVPMAVAKGVAL